MHENATKRAWDLKLPTETWIDSNNNSRLRKCDHVYLSTTHMLRNFGTNYALSNALMINSFATLLLSFFAIVRNKGAGCSRRLFIECIQTFIEIYQLHFTPTEYWTYKRAQNNMKNIYYFIPQFKKWTFCNILPYYKM